AGGGSAAPGGQRPRNEWDDWMAALRDDVGSWAHSGDAPRDIELVALFGTKYARNTVAYQRKAALRILKPLQDDRTIIGAKVSRNAYLDLLGRAKIVLSLFGWGEIC